MEKKGVYGSLSNSYKLTMTELRKLQLVELDLLCEVDRICRKYNLIYYLCAGTLLGAVRHQGFIPWDDDIDVSMPFADYKKFCEVCKEELDVEKYFLQNMDSDPKYQYIFAKFRRQGTLYVRKGQEHMGYNHGINIDIFPLYPYPKHYVTAGIYTFIIAKCKTIMWSPIGAVSEKKLVLRMIYKLASKIPLKLPRSIIDWLFSLCKDVYLVNVGAPSFGRKRQNKMKMRKLMPRREIIEKLRIKEVIELDFEGHKFFAPANYDFKLQYIYGDYMTLPPESERLGHHQATTIEFGNSLDDIAMN